MTPKQAAATAVTSLSEMFRQPLTPLATETYIEAIEGMGPELISVAMKRAARECKFMPTPSELRELAGISGPKVLAKAVAEAWEAVAGAMRKHDYTDSVDFGPLVNAVIRNMGGWQAACGWTVSEIETWKRKEFAALYESFAAGDQSTLRGEPLAGKYPGRVHLVAIGGVMPLPQLAAVPSPVSAVVRELAEAKSMNGKPAAAPAEPSVSEAIAADREADRKARAAASDARAAEAVAKLRERVATSDTEAA